MLVESRPPRKGGGRDSTCAERQGPQLGAFRIILRIIVLFYSIIGR